MKPPSTADQTERKAPSTADQTERKAPSTADQTERKAPSTADEAERKAPSTADQTERKAPATADQATQTNDVVAGTADQTTQTNEVVAGAADQTTQTNEVVAGTADQTTQTNDVVVGTADQTTQTNDVVARTGIKVKCTYFFDDFVNKVYYNNVDLSAGIDSPGACCRQRTFEFEYVEGAVLAFLGQDMQSGDQAAFSLQCDSPEPSWNFRLSAQNAHEHVRAMGSGQNTVTSEWYANDYRPEDCWSPPGQSRRYPRDPHRVWLGTYKYNWIRVTPFRAKG